MKGIKGFDKDLKCRGFQYEIGKAYSIEDKPRLCSNGFHYCSNLNDVYKHYPNKNGNRYCVVEILGDVDSGNDKSCTDKIKILQEIDPNKKSFTTKDLSNLNMMGYVIGGSMALKIHGYNISREMKDLDLLVDKIDYDKFSKDFKGMQKINRYSGIDSKCAYKDFVLNMNYDIILQTDLKKVERLYDGYKLIVVDEAQIWECKLNYALNGHIKHQEDIKNCNVKFAMIPKESSTYFEEDLPF